MFIFKPRQQPIGYSIMFENIKSHVKKSSAMNSAFIWKRGILSSRIEKLKARSQGIVELTSEYRTSATCIAEKLFYK